MFKHLFSLEWKSFFRSASLGKSIGLKILMGFLGLYFLVAFLTLGIGLYPLIIEHFPGEEPLYFVNRFVLVWLLMEIGYRFLLQNLPITDIKPLMLLPIKRRKVVNFVLIKSLYSFFNFLPLLIIIPFGIYNIYKQTFSTVAIIAWMLAMIFLTLSANYANFIIKKNFTNNIKALLPIVGVIAGLGILDYLQIFESSVWFGKGLDAILEMPYLAGIAILIFFVFFKWNQKDLESRFYLDATLKEEVQDANTKEFLWTRRFGDLAPYLQQDLKLIWRNKRPKSTIFLSLLFLGYGLIFYPSDAYQAMPTFYVFIGIFITGMFMINFGQFIPAWDSAYYSVIMAQNIPLRKYLNAKAALITISVILLAVLSTPYIYFGWKILLVNMVCALYNIGVNIPVLLYAGSFNRKRIDLDKSAMMNYQGMGATQWIVGLPLMLIPMLIFWIFNKFISFEIAIAVLFALGVLGLILRNRAISFIARRYKQQKYAMIAGFKQSGE